MLMETGEYLKISGKEVYVVVADEETAVFAPIETRKVVFKGENESIIDKITGRKRKRGMERTINYEKLVAYSNLDEFGHLINIERD